MIGIWKHAGKVRKMQNVVQEAYQENGKTETAYLLQCTKEGGILLKLHCVYCKVN